MFLLLMCMSLFLSRDKSTEYGPTFAALHRQWWCLEIPETYSSWTKNSKISYRDVPNASYELFIGAYDLRIARNIYSEKLYVPLAWSFFKSIRSPQWAIFTSKRYFTNGHVTGTGQDFAFVIRCRNWISHLVILVFPDPHFKFKVIHVSTKWNS